MNRIDKKFKELKKQGKKAFIAFIMAGDPSLNATERIIFELERQGTDIIELGVPFSDPLADGPTIQRASERALKNRISIPYVCRLVKRLREKIETPIVFLTYYNLIYQHGLEKFVRAAKDSGVDGVIIPDLPPEESGTLRAVARKRNFAVIHLVSPTSSEKRIKKIVKASSGFIYYVSLTGTTGARDGLADKIFEGLRKVKAMAKQPVCVGFGISRSDQIKLLAKWADGVIVGSAIIDVVEKNIGDRNLAEKVGHFVRGLSGNL